MPKDSRYNDRERDRSPHFRPVRDDRDRRSIPDHNKPDVRSSRDHRYNDNSKGTHYFNFIIQCTDILFFFMKTLEDLNVAVVIIGAITQVLGKYLVVTLVVLQQNLGLRILGDRIQNQVVHQTGT